MNKGTKIRTALRIAFSIYTAFCMWQVSIGELSQQLHAPWLVGLCAIIIVISGIVVDFLTTYYNNDYTEEGCIGTGVTRQLKAEKENGYIGDYFYKNDENSIAEDEELMEEEVVSEEDEEKEGDISE